MAPPKKAKISGNRRPSPGVKPLKSTDPGKKSKSKNQRSKVNPSVTPRDHNRPETQCKTPSKLPDELQQLMLDIFKNTFSSRFDENLPSLIQDVKRHLFNRDFANAFGAEAYLEAYAMRWSPNRALAYMDILCSLPDLSAYITYNSRATSGEAARRAPGFPDQVPSASARMEATARVDTANILCLGGGSGAEVVALAGYLRHVNAAAQGDIISKPHRKIERGRSPPLEATVPVSFKVTAIDIADWSDITRKLFSSVTTSPVPFQHAQNASFPPFEATNAPLVDPSLYEIQFFKQDLLKMEVDQLTMVLKDTALVTLMFTLNELYSSSMSATTNLLLSLTHLLSSGSLLLVVDSPGSYSTVSIGKAADDASDPSAEKKYPMQWLLNHTLLESAAISSSTSGTQEKQWERLESHDSRWFRLSDALKYPIDLEDMRYQIHLYRRL